LVLVSKKYRLANSSCRESLHKNNSSKTLLTRLKVIILRRTKRTRRTRRMIKLPAILKGRPKKVRAKINSVDRSRQN
jgi:hypothetical protein